MRLFLITFLFAFSQGSVFADAQDSCPDEGISFECISAASKTVDDLKLHHGAEINSLYKDIVCSESKDGEIYVWVRNIEELASGGGWMFIYDIETGELIKKMASR